MEHAVVPESRNPAAPKPDGNQKALGRAPSKYIGPDISGPSIAGKSADSTPTEREVHCRPGNGAHRVCGPERPHAPAPASTRALPPVGAFALLRRDFTLSSHARCDAGRAFAQSNPIKAAMDAFTCRR
jgi:hypothetical protein